MNKIIKKVVSVVTAVAIALTAVVVFDLPEKLVAEAAASGNGWTLDDSGKLTIENDTGMTNWAKLPEKSDFTYVNSVRSVEIKNGVTFIGSYAFSHCLSNTPITIPNSVTSIKDYAFDHFQSAIPITIPSSVTSIECAAFQNSNFTSIMILNSSVNIHEYAFLIYKNGAIIYPSSLTISGDYVSATQAKYTSNGSKLKITEIIYGDNRKRVTISDDMNINFVAESERAKVYTSGHTHLGGTATCAAKARCEICNAEHGEKLTTHTWNAGAVTKAATCTATGVKTYTCSVCGATKTETINATGHSITHTAAKAATCTATGNIEYCYCSTCKKYFSNSACTTEITQASTVVAALGHNTSGSIAHKDAT